MKMRPTTIALLLTLIVTASPSLLGGENGAAMKRGLPASNASPAQGNLPSARQLLDNHLRLTGSASVKSYIVKGSLTGFDQGNVRVEFYKDGEKELAKLFFPSGEQEVEFYDGDSGWRKEHGQDVIDLGGSSGEEPESLGLYVKSLFLLNNEKNILGDYEAVKVTGPTKLNSRDTYILEGKIKGGGLDKYYFDKQGGVLLQSQGFDESNKLTSELVWSDYRNVGGKQVPHRVQVKQGAGAFSVEVSEIKINTKINPAIFTKPED
jgi:hypothetical protein